MSVTPSLRRLPALLLWAFALSACIPTTRGEIAEADTVAEPAGGVRAEPGSGTIEIVRNPDFVGGVRGGQIGVPLVGVIPRTVNPIAAREGREQRVQNLWHGALLRRSPDGTQREAWLADAIRVTDREILVRLRADLQWSDGTPLTAATWVRSVEEYYLDRTIAGPWHPVLRPPRHLISWIAESPTELRVVVEPVDEEGRELALRALEVPPLPLHLLDPIRRRGGARAVVDAGHLRAPDPREAPDFLPASSWAYSGPFVLDSVDENGIELRRNEVYPIIDENGIGLPYLDRLSVATIADANDALRLLSTGEIALAEVGPMTTDFAALATLDVRVTLGSRSPRRVELIGRGVSPELTPAVIEASLWGDLADEEPAGVIFDPIPSNSSARPQIFLVPSTTIGEHLASVFRPEDLEIAVRGPSEYLSALFDPTQRAAALLLTDAPYPPRATIPVNTGEVRQDLSGFLRPRVVVDTRVANLVPDTHAYPLWIGSADRLFLLGGASR